MGFQVHLCKTLPPESLQSLCCPLCRQLLDVPVRSNICGHVFCESCAIPSKGECVVACPQVFCPVDNSPITKQSVHNYTDSHLLDTLDQLVVSCPHAGCSLTGSYLQMRLHRHTCAHLPDPLCVDPTHSAAPTSSIDQLKRINQINESQISDLRFVFDRLSEQIQSQMQQHNLLMRKRLEMCERTSHRLQNHLWNLQDQLAKLLHPDNVDAQSVQPSDTRSPSDTCVAYVRNLDQFLTAEILHEFLRQNGVHVISCEIQITTFERSRDFRIQFASCDISKLLDCNLWPVGVCVHLQCPDTPGSVPKTIDNDHGQQPRPTVIYGQRTSPSTLLIKSGLIY